MSRNSSDLFSYDGVYTFRSDFKNEPRLGEGDSLYNDFSYDHRFLITGKWYFRTGFESSATILAAPTMDCLTTSRRSTDISQLNMW